MWLTFGLSGFVLLIACANLANLQLVRTAARVREQTIRAALGAGRLRLLRQSLTESCVVACTGGVVGFAVAKGVIEFVNRRLFAELPLARVILDLRVFAFTLLCSVLTGLLFGAVPALLASRADVNASLSDRPRGSTSSSHATFRHAFTTGHLAPRPPPATRAAFELPRRTSNGCLRARRGERPGSPPCKPGSGPSGARARWG